MSKGLNNPKAFSTQDEAEASPIITPVQIVDGGDFPHTGLIKALSLGMKGNYATTGFNATAVTDNDVTFAAGVVYRDGKKVDVNAGTTQTIVIGSTSGTTTDHNVGYHLVVNATGTTNLSVRPPTGANAVPAYTEGDVIIAILAYTTQDPMQIQFLTVEKIENSLSIAYNDSGYTEAMTIQATADRTTFKNKVANADIRFILADNTADEKFEILSDDDSDGDEGDTEIFSVDGLGVTSVKSLKLGTAGELTITESSDDITIKNTVSDKDIIFKVNDGGVDTEVLRLDGATANVGIGTNAPTEKLHLSDADGTEPTILIENTGTNASEPELVFFRSTASPASSMDIGHIKWKGRDDGGNIHNYANIFADMFDETGGTEDGRIVFSAARGGTDSVEYMRMGGGDIVFNETSADLNIRVETNGNDRILFIDGGNDKIGIGTITPSEILHVVGNVKITNDLTLGGGDIAMGNGQDSTIKVDATTSSTAGRDLTIEAGSSATGSANINGGDLILKAGGGDGSGTSIMTFSTKVDGTDAVAERMRISTIGNVGIGTTAPTQKLGVSGAIGAAAFVSSVTEISGNPLPSAGLTSNPNTGTPCLALSSETHRTIIADTTAFSPHPTPSNGPLSLLLPAASGTHQGWEMRIICKANAGGSDNLLLDVTGSSDLIVDAQMATIGNQSTGFTLATGKIYTVIHISSTMYMCIILN